MTNPSEAVELLPCPFDGNAAELRQTRDEFSRARIVVTCRGCGAQTDPSIGEQSAIAAWNRRAPQQGVEAVRVGLDTMRRIVAHWIEFDTESRAREGLTTEPGTHLVAPPHWPTHGSLAMWVQTLAKADAILAALRPSPDSGGRTDG